MDFHRHHSDWISVSVAVMRLHGHSHVMEVIHGLLHNSPDLDDVLRGSIYRLSGSSTTFPLNGKSRLLNPFCPGGNARVLGLTNSSHQTKRFWRRKLELLRNEAKQLRRCLLSLLAVFSPLLVRMSGTNGSGRPAWTDFTAESDQICCACVERWHFVLRSRLEPPMLSRNPSGWFFV